MRESRCVSSGVGEEGIRRGMSHIEARGATGEASR
jgi:hypothetical protein